MKGFFVISIIISIIVIALLAGCQGIILNSTPESCSDEYDFSSAKISNNYLMPESQYVAKQGGYLFFSDVKGNGNGQTEVKISIEGNNISRSLIANGSKETETLEPGTPEYKQVTNQILNLTEQYIREAKAIEGYDKEHFLAVEKYRDCLKKIR